MSTNPPDDFRTFNELAGSADALMGDFDGARHMVGMWRNSLGHHFRGSQIFTHSRDKVEINANDPGGMQFAFPRGRTAADIERALHIALTIMGLRDAQLEGKGIADEIKRQIAEVRDYVTSALSTIPESDHVSARPIYEAYSDQVVALIEMVHSLCQKKIADVIYLPRLGGKS